MNNRNRPLESRLRKCDSCHEIWQSRNCVVLLKGWQQGSETLCRKCWEVLILAAHADLVVKHGLA